MDPAACSLRLQLFGTFDARLHGHPLPHLRSEKGKMLLAYLALRRGSEVSHTELAEALWPDAGPSNRAFENLRKTLGDLRKALGGKENPYLQAPTRHTLCLNLEATEVDLLSFERALRHMDTPSLERAISLYHGPLLEDWAELWIYGERETCRQKGVEALEKLRIVAMAQGNSVSARDCLRRLVAMEALEEQDWRALMQTLIEHKDYATATRVFEELGKYATPNEATRQLYQQIPLKERTPSRRPHKPSVHNEHLPYPLTDLIGRDNEIREVESRLGSRLVTLAGSGGVGKTRLAIHVAHKVADRYSERAWFIDLASLTDPTLLVQQVASKLGIRAAPGQPLLETLVACLRPRQRLLVLDNCEHLLEACARLVHRLLVECPNLHILATSRQALGIKGEVVWRVPSLSLPDLKWVVCGEKDVPARMMEYDAIRLFVERAGQKQPTFKLTSHNAEAVAQMCHRLDGIPLAIELAAARIGVLTAVQVAARLDDRFRLLTDGDRTVLPRHQTLRALIDWSYDLLSAQERVLLRRLSVFAGGWTLEAAEAVCSTDEEKGERKKEKGTAESSRHPTPDTRHPYEVLDLLTSLVDKSLVVYVERGEREGRYHLLETIRQYAQERLAATNEAGALRGRHRDYFLRLAEEVEPQLHGAEQGVWLDRLETEHDNLRTALAWCLKAGERGKEKGEREEAEQAASSSLKSQVSSLSLAGAMYQFWYMHGYLSEGRSYLEEALGQQGAAERTQARAKALNRAGGLAYLQGDYDTARARYEESLAIQRELGDKQGIAASLTGLGNVASAQSEYVAARALFEEALAIRQELGDKGGIAASLTGLGDVAFHQGDYRAAEGLQEKSLAIQRELGDKWGIALSLIFLGHVVDAQGDYAAAREWYEEALLIRRELGDKQGIAWSLNALGHVAIHQSDYARAGTVCEQAKAIFRELGDKQGIAASLNALGHVASAQSEYVAARALFEEALAIRQELGDKGGIAWSLTGLGHVAIHQSDYARAGTVCEEGLAIFRELGDKQGIDFSLHALGSVAYAQGDYEQACALHQESLAIKREQGNRAGIVWSLEALASQAAMAADLARAARLAGAAERLREDLGTLPPTAQRDWYERALATAREQLGSDAFTSVWDEGRAMSTEQAVQLALEPSGKSGY